jgi:hypothetical protein
VNLYFNELLIAALVVLEGPYEPTVAVFKLVTRMGASQPKKRPVGAPVAFGGIGSSA